MYFPPNLKTWLRACAATTGSVARPNKKWSTAHNWAKAHSLPTTSLMRIPDMRIIKTLNALYYLQQTS